MRISFEDVHLMKKFIVIFLLIFTVSNNVFANADSLEKENTVKSHKLIGLNEAHKLGYTGKDQVIVVIDTGSNPDHISMSGQVIDGFCSSKVACGELYLKSGIEAGKARKLPGYDFIDEHGSLVSGIIAGKPTASFPGGVAPGAKIISINNQMGHWDGLIAAFDWILSIKDKYNIVAINGSFGLTTPGTRYNQDYCPKFDDFDKRLKAFYDSNIVFIASSGNSGSLSNILYPACSKYVIGVGAVDPNGKIWDYSDIGKDISVLAPADVLGVYAQNNNGYWAGGGTSSSAPVVAGAVAILKQAYPKATFNQIKNALMTSNTYIDDVMWSKLSVLNIPAALKSMQTNNFSNNKVIPTNNNIKLESLNDEIVLLKNENNKLNNIIAETNKDISSYKSTIEKLNKQLSDLSEEKNKLLDLQKENETLKKEASDAKKMNENILKKVKIICNSKSRSALCRSLGL